MWNGYPCCHGKPLPWQVHQLWVIISSMVWRYSLVWKESVENISGVEHRHPQDTYSGLHKSLQ